MLGEVVRIGFFFLVMSVTTWWRFGNKYRRVLLCSVALMLTSIIPYTPSDTGMYTSVRPFQPTRRQAGRDQIWRPKKKINPRRLTCGGLSTGSDAVVHAFIHFSFRFSDRSLCSWHLAPKRGCRTRARSIPTFLKSRGNFKVRCFVSGLIWSSATALVYLSLYIICIFDNETCCSS